MASASTSAPARHAAGLPNEVLHRIFDLVHVDGQEALYAAEAARLQPRNLYSDLTELALSSRRFYEAVRNQFLYRTVNLQTLSATTSLASLFRHEAASKHETPASQLVRQLHTPNEGLFARNLVRNDYNVNTVLMYAPALRTIFKEAINLETVFIVKNYQSEFTDRENDALDIFVDEFAKASTRSASARASLKRLTIACEPYLERDPRFARVLDVPNLSHLSLVAWHPPSLSVFGEGIFSSLKVLRLSHLASFTVSDPVILERHQSRQAQAEAQGAPLPDPEPNTVLALGFYEELTQKFEGLEVLVLELVKMDELSAPHLTDDEAARPPPYDPNDWNLTLSVRDMVCEHIVRAEGRLALPCGLRAKSTLADGSREAHGFLPGVPQTIEELGDQRPLIDTADIIQRKQYWHTVREYKTWLEKSVRSARLLAGNRTPFEVRIAPSRELVRRCREFCLDPSYRLYAAHHCDDLSAFSDPDIFALVARYPYLGFRFTRDQDGNPYSYWTGILPPPPDESLYLWM